jgi:gamma-glutamylcyclotransferase (GGCT)/AIG2-like uncharacterized protein YtfP
MKQYLFVYGSLLLSSAHEKLGFKIEPLYSAYIFDYILTLKSNRENTYDYMIATPILSRILFHGYICEVTEEQLIRLDRYESKEMKRIKVDAFTRDRKKIECWLYTENE